MKFKHLLDKTAAIPYINTVQVIKFYYCFKSTQNIFHSQKSTETPCYKILRKHENGHKTCLLWHAVTSVSTLL